MADNLTFDEYFRIGRNEMLLRQASLRAADIDTPGTQANALVALAAALAEEVTGSARRDWVDSWLGSAEGAALRRLVRDRYRVEPKLASFAYGSVDLTLEAAVAEPVQIPVGSEVANTRGVTYRTTTPAVIPTGSVGPISADIASLITGPQAVSAPNTIRAFKTSLGITVNVTNPYATAGGDPEEDDATLRARAIDSALGEGNGTADAIVRAARAVPGVTSAQAFEITGALGVPERAILLFITDAFTEDLIITAPNGSSAYALQSDALAKTVMARLSSARPLGTPVYIYVSKVRLITIRMALTYSANANSPRALDQAISTAVAYTNLRRPAGVWDRVAANRGLLGTPGLIVSGNEFAYPTGNVVPRYYEVIRTMPSMVSA